MLTASLCYLHGFTGCLVCVLNFRPYFLLFQFAVHTPFSSLDKTSLSFSHSFQVQHIISADWKSSASFQFLCQSIKKEWGVAVSEHLDHFNSCLVQSSLLIFISQFKDSPEIITKVLFPSYRLLLFHFTLDPDASPRRVEHSRPCAVLLSLASFFFLSLSCQGSSSKSNTWKVQQSTSFRRKLSPN